MSEPALQIEELRKDRGESFSLAVDRLEIGGGELFCLLGPTGAGKSTLLGLMGGLAAPSGGTVRFDGQPVTDRLPLADRRRMTLVHQTPRLLTGSVQYNVEYGLRLRKVSRPGERAASVLDRLGLADRACQDAATLSGGQRQLVALARALVLEPEVLLLDEPTAGLDPARVALIERVIAETRRERETTIVWATHNVFQARRVAERAGLLLDGRLIETAPTQPFFEAPSDPRTAAFVEGRMIY